MNNLYEEIGGEVAMKQMVDALVDRMYKDEEIGYFFVHGKLDNHKFRLNQFFTMALGGPQTYQGEPLKFIHKGRGIR